MKYTLLALVLLSSMAMAESPFETPPGLTKPKGGSNATSQSVSNSSAQSTAIAGSTSGAISYASGGNASATGGSASSVSQGGQGGVGYGGNGGSATGGQAGDSSSVTEVNIDQSSNGSNNVPKQDFPVSPAASLYLNGCQDGASGTGQSASAAVGFESAVCTSLRLAETYQKLMLFYSEKGDMNQAAMYEKLMNSAIADAGASSDFLYYPKNAGSGAASIIPLGLLGWLIVLI